MFKEEDLQKPVIPKFKIGEKVKINHTENSSVEITGVIDNFFYQAHARKYPFYALKHFDDNQETLSFSKHYTNEIIERQRFLKGKIQAIAHITPSNLFNQFFQGELTLKTKGSTLNQEEKEELIIKLLTDQINWKPIIVELEQGVSQLVYQTDLFEAVIDFILNKFPINYRSNDNKNHSIYYSNLNHKDIRKLLKKNIKVIYLENINNLNEADVEILLEYRSEHHTN